MCPQSSLGGLAQRNFALCLGVFLLEPLDIVGLPQGLGAEGPDGGGQ